LETVNKPLFVILKPLFVTNKPLFVILKPLFVTNKPLLMTLKPLFVTNKPNGGSELGFKTSNKPNCDAQLGFKTDYKPNGKRNQPFSKAQRPNAAFENIQFKDKPCQKTRQRGSRPDQPPYGTTPLGRSCRSAGASLVGRGSFEPKACSVRPVTCPASTGFDQRFAQRRHQPRQRYRLSRLGPRLPVHPHPELALAGKRDPRKLDFQAFIPLKILDGNSQICFHKPMLTKANANSTVHAALHALRPNTC
jgi:hypothetical protein